MQLCPKRTPQEGASQGDLEVEKIEERGLEFSE